MSQAETNISFEFFPPKTDEGKKKLNQAAKALAKCFPDFFSVTFGAGGSTREGTLETVASVKQVTQKTVVPHIACVGSTRAEIKAMLTRYKAAGLNRIIALRGDLPSGIKHCCDIPYATDLVALIREITGNYFHIEVAAYPEFHPQAKSALHDLLNLKQKAEAGADGAITQYFYNPDAYFYFLDECAKLDISIPITPGIMPIINFQKLIRFSDMCGADIPLWMRKRFDSYDDEESMQALGIEIVYSLCERLLAGGAPGLHFYTLNQAETSLTLLKMLNLGFKAPRKLKELA